MDMGRFEQHRGHSAKKWEFWESGEGIPGFVSPWLSGLDGDLGSRFVPCAVRNSAENSWMGAWRA